MERAILPREQLRLSVPGVELIGDLTRGGDRGALLFAHGAGQTGGAWLRTSLRLAKSGWTTLTVDARGHGRSGRNAPDLPYTPDQLVDDLHRWSEILQDKPVLIGASMGGLAGLVAQACHDCFSALVLVDVTPRWEPAGVARILDFMRTHGAGFDSIDDAADVIAAYMPHRPRKSAVMLASLLERDADGRWRWHWDPRFVDDLSQRIESGQTEVVEAARAIGVPTLLLTGGASDVVSRDNIDDFLALVPHAQHAEIADARHMIAGDDNDAFTRVLGEFLDGLSASHAVTEKPVRLARTGSA